MKTENFVNKIKNEFSENINSHVFLVETNNFDLCLNDIKEVIKSLIKANDIVERQINNETYLELNIIRPDGKDIKRDQIGTLQEKLNKMPILSNYIFYVISEAEKMNETAANKLLKTIEEPNTNNVGFFITNNLDQILPTIKSRCEILYSMYKDKLIIQSDSEDDLNEITSKFINCIESNNLLEANLIKNSYSKIKENGKLIANLIKDYYNTACEVQNAKNVDTKTIDLIKKHSSYNTIVNKSIVINRMLNNLSGNMNSDLLLEKIFIELGSVK